MSSPCNVHVSRCYAALLWRDSPLVDAPGAPKLVEQHPIYRQRNFPAWAKFDKDSFNGKLSTQAWQSKVACTPSLSTFVAGIPRALHPQPFCSIPSISSEPKWRSGDLVCRHAYTCTMYHSFVSHIHIYILYVYIYIIFYYIILYICCEALGSANSPRPPALLQCARGLGQGPSPLQGLYIYIYMYACIYIYTYIYTYIYIYIFI